MMSTPSPQLRIAARTGNFVSERYGDRKGAPRTLYLDTTIPSFLTARRSRDIAAVRMQVTTRRWWKQHLSRYVVYVSDLVVEEASRGDSEAARRRIEAISSFCNVTRSARTYELADEILRTCRLPARLHADAHHVAIAALNDIKILLTWNCAHLANRNMLPYISRACTAQGCTAPEILTPEQLIGVCAYGRSDS
jgi:hypothetical protein